MNMHITPPYAHFLVADDNITTSVAEDSIITSGAGVKVSQSRMSFFARSKGNSCFSFHQVLAGCKPQPSGWISAHGPCVR
jgi:hypothetical protein